MPPFPRAGPLGEDVEDQRRAIENLAVENFFQVAALGGREFVIKNDGVDLLLPALERELAGFSGADERSRDRAVQFLGAITDDGPAGGGRQFGQFVQGIAHVPSGASFNFQAHQKNAFGFSGGLRDERLQ